MPIVAICGDKGAGKDTLCEDLMKMDFDRFIIYGGDGLFQMLLTYDNERFAFADKVKEDFAKHMNFSVSDWDNISSEKKDQLRPLLHDFSAAKKLSDPNYYNKELLERNINDKCIIITDLRLESEIKYIENLGCDYLTIKVIDMVKDRPEKSEYERQLDKLGTDYVAIRRY